MLTENIARVRSRIALAAEKSGRKVEDITLVAVSKTVPASQVLEAWKAGVTDFGESYLQEARVKIPEINSASNAAGTPICWHMIGHLQSNKVKYSVDLFSIIHSVDSYQLVKEIDRQAAKRDKTQDILLEVELTGIPTRSGVSVTGLPVLVEQALSLPQVRLRGLMGIAPPELTFDEARRYFARMRDLFDALPTVNRQILSLGMSGDFEAAIQEGATHVRIGSALFGERVTPAK